MKWCEYIAITSLEVLPKMSGHGAIFRSLNRIASQRALPYKVVHDCMSDESLSYIRDFKPDVIVTMFHQIIREKLLRLAPLGVVNIHPGILPYFRGIQPYFWELSEGHSSAGATLHFIEDETVDTGRILSIATYAVIPRMSVQLNYYLSTRCAAAVLPKTLTLLQAGTLEPKLQTQEDGNYYRWPSSEAVTRLYGKGHSITRLKDLWQMLRGKYDEFTPESVTLFEKV
jgi:methionyl-tRNA formyltransferase